jgi:hypothetical protein
MEKPLQIIEEHLLTESSSNIKKSIYNHWEKTLTLVFHNGHAYKYLEVDEETFKQYKEHESKGKAHVSLIKEKYEFEKL